MSTKPDDWKEVVVDTHLEESFGVKVPTPSMAWPLPHRCKAAQNTEERMSNGQTFFHQGGGYKFGEGEYTTLKVGGTTRTACRNGKRLTRYLTIVPAMTQHQTPQDTRRRMRMGNNTPGAPAGALVYPALCPVMCPPLQHCCTQPIPPCLFAK